MSKLKKTRSNTSKELLESKIETNNKAKAVRKVFFLPAQTVEDESANLNIEQFYHPGQGRKALFLENAASKEKSENKLLEIKEFAEPRRCWFADTNVCSNGRIYMVVPVDVTFLVLHQIKKFCSKDAVPLNNIIDENDSSVAQLIENYSSPDMLNCIADATTFSDITFYQYNHTKCLAWLAIKVKNLAKRIKKEGIYCGYSSLSQNYAKSKLGDDTEDETDFLRTAYDVVGSYLDLTLCEELKKYLAIPSREEKSKISENKRKSLKALNADDNKKIKLNDSDDKLNTSFEDGQIKATSAKERKVTAKEKALAKGAKGTKSISSFFKK